jgi:hypothetical protein
VHFCLYLWPEGIHNLVDHMNITISKLTWVSFFLLWTLYFVLIYGFFIFVPDLFLLENEYPTYLCDENISFNHCLNLEQVIYMHLQKLETCTYYYTLFWNSCSHYTKSCRSPSIPQRKEKNSVSLSLNYVTSPLLHIYYFCRNQWIKNLEFELQSLYIVLFLSTKFCLSCHLSDPIVFYSFIRTFLKKFSFSFLFFFLKKHNCIEK